MGARRKAPAMATNSARKAGEKKAKEKVGPRKARVTNSPKRVEETTAKGEAAKAPAMARNLATRAKDEVGKAGPRIAAAKASGKERAGPKEGLVKIKARGLQARSP